MEPHRIMLVQESFEQVLPIADTAATIFYARLFALDRSLETLFPADLGQQRQKLMTTLNTAVNGLWRFDRLKPGLQKLGARHTGYGVQPEHYALVGQALLETLAEGLGRAFTPEVEAAWQEAYALIAATMQSEVSSPA